MVCPAGMEQGGEDELPVSGVFKHVGDSLTVRGGGWFTCPLSFSLSFLFWSF